MGLIAAIPATRARLAIRVLLFIGEPLGMSWLLSSDCARGESFLTVAMILRPTVRETSRRVGVGCEKTSGFAMHIAILTFDGFNELDSLIAYGMLSRVSLLGDQDHDTNVFGAVSSWTSFS